MFHIKALIKACEKASTHLKRDLSEILHLQNSRNIRTFLNNSQAKLERTLYFELQNLGLASVKIIQSNSNKDFPITPRGSLKLVVMGLDNLTIFSHGLNSLTFGLSLMEDDRILGTTLCVPAKNTIILTSKEGLALLDSDGLSKKIKMQNSTNISLSTILGGVDKENFRLDSLLKRDFLPISSGSLLYDVNLLLQSQLDLVCHKKPEEELMIRILDNLVMIGGGLSTTLDCQYCLGKVSMIKSLSKQEKE